MNSDPKTIEQIAALQRTIDQQLAQEVSGTRVNIGITDKEVVLTFGGIGTITLTATEARYMAGLLRQAANELDRMEPQLNQTKPARRRHRH